jgi:hypothetical protein
MVGHISIERTSLQWILSNRLPNCLPTFLVPSIPEKTKGIKPSGVPQMDRKGIFGSKTPWVFRIGLLEGHWTKIVVTVNGIAT